MAIFDGDIGPLRSQLDTPGLTILLLCGAENSMARQIHDYVVSARFETEPWWRCHLVTRPELLSSDERQRLGVRPDHFAMLRIRATDPANSTGSARRVHGGPADSLRYSRHPEPSPGKIRLAFFRGDRG